MNKENNKQNVFSSSIFSNIDANDFLLHENPIEQKNKSDNQIWLNEIDSTLILENIDKTAKNRYVKINLKLKTLSNSLAKITEELKILELFNLEKDKEKRNQLINLKSNIEKQIVKLKSEKKKFGIFYIIADYTNNKINYANIMNLKSFIVNKFKLAKTYIKNLSSSNKKITSFIKLVK